MIGNPHLAGKNIELLRLVKQAHDLSSEPGAHSTELIECYEKIIERAASALGSATEERITNAMRRAT